MDSTEQRVQRLEKQLRQARLELEMARDREFRLKDSRKNILATFNELFAAEGGEQQYSVLIMALRRIVQFDDIAVLCHNPESDPPGALEVIYASSPVLEKHRWTMDGVLGVAYRSDDVLVLSNPGAARGFESSDGEFARAVRSAMVIPIAIEGLELFFIMTHHSPLSLDMRSREDVKEYLPFIEQSIACVEYRTQLDRLVARHASDLSAYRRTLDSLRTLHHEMLWQTDRDGVFIKVTSTVFSYGVEITDTSENTEIYNTVIGKNVRGIVDPEELARNPHILDELEKTIAERGVIKNVKFPILLASGKIWIKINGEPYYGKDGGYLGYHGIVKNITRSQMERAAFESARVAAEQADRSKNEYLAVLSHEIKTPLQAILGMIDLLEQTELTGLQSSYIKHVHQSASLLQSLLHNVLDLSRITSKAMTLENLSFDIRFTLNSTVIQMTDRAKEKNIWLRLNIADNFPTLIYGDKHRLSQILFNLINNALKFTSEGGVTVTAERFGNRLKFSIADTGPGIEPENLGNLFQPFVQEDSTISGKYGGTGLGLSICKQLVEHMGGKIGIRSEKGKGSTFWFEIPCKVPSLPLIGANSVKSGKTEHRDRKYSILLVEDSQLNQFVIKAMLEKLGHTVRLANNGAEAIEETRKALPDLVFMDIRMPVMDGIEATRRILGTVAPLPIIALTANNSDQERIECRKVGMISIAMKPVTTKTLKALLEELEGVIEEYDRNIREGNYKLGPAPEESAAGREDTLVGAVSSENTVSNAPLIDSLIKNKLGTGARAGTAPGSRDGPGEAKGGKTGAKPK